MTNNELMKKIIELRRERTRLELKRTKWLDGWEARLASLESELKHTEIALENAERQ